jgi:hypothetical protein
MTLAEVLTIGVAFIALCVSGYSLWLQYNPEGARIELLNADDPQRKTARPHKDLPESIQKAYPDIPDALPGYVLVKLVLGNAGDRAGVANIKALSARYPPNPQLTIRASTSDYVLIPAYEIVEQEILLRNMQLGESFEKPIEIEVKIECGGYNPRTGKYEQKGTIEKILLVSIVRGDENPWMSFGADGV